MPCPAARRVPAALLTLARLAVVAAVAPGGVGAQPTVPGAAPTEAAVAGVGPRTVRSVPAERAPVLDGRDDDPVWRDAPATDDFRVFDPVEDGAPRFRTTVRVAHDARHLYAFVRAYDPRPDSVLALLSRRDVRTQSDQLKLMVDSYHDRRTAYEFAVNPAGVKRDYYAYDDAREDVSWDAVWDVATRVDSLGWTAEFRIPLSQLRFPRGAPGAARSFGLMVMRDIGRTGERLAWPTYRRSRPGIASQFGELTGLTGLATPQRLEVSPYVLTRNASALRAGPGPGAPPAFGRAQGLATGADVKWGLSSNLTLDASVNPDFGQVEADPAVLNLTAFEVFQQERRPFFVEGTGIFRAGPDPTRLFYSRRIGRAPQLAALVQDPYATPPRASTILGAAKLTGRLARGTSLGVLGAHTDREHVGATVVEPRTTVGVARIAQDLRGGETTVGVMTAGLQRALADPAAAARLRREALAGGVDVRHRFGGRQWEATGALQASRVAGTAGAIARTQRSGVHYFQRPDAGLPYDTTRTTLAGTALSAGVNKVAGTFTMNTLYERVTPGFETNDVGYLERADVQRAYAELIWRARRPRAFWRNATGTLFTSHRWTADGLPLGHMYDGWVDVQFRNQTRAFAEVWVDQVGTWCDRCAFGGRAFRQSPARNLLLQLNGDARRALYPVVAAIFTSGDEGASRLWRVRPIVRWRAGTQLGGELGARYEHRREASQWVANTGSGAAARSHFAPLDQRTASLTVRLDYTIRPALSFQLYGEPFVTGGRYDAPRVLVAPAAPRWADRFAPSTLGPVNGFNVKQLRSNAVLRWEYRPGSTLFLVWQQGRDQDDRDMGSFAARRDVRNLFAARPDNTLLVKASYWFGR
jgi:hypothetical protein